MGKAKQFCNRQHNGQVSLGVFDQVSDTFGSNQQLHSSNGAQQDKEKSALRVSSTTPLFTDR